MLWYLGLALLFGASLLVVALTGRALVELLGIRRLSRRTAEHFAAAAVLGTAYWVLVGGWLSYLGLGLRIAAGPVLLGALILVGLATGRNGPAFLLPDRRDRASVALFAIALLGGLISMLPIALGNAFLVANDSVTYAGLAEYIQDHGFSEPAPKDPHRYVVAHVEFFQAFGFRMGTNFLLGLVQALSFAPRAIEVFPAVAALGIALNVLGVFLLARWSLGLSHGLALLAGFILAVGPNPTQSAAAHGFLPQTYGTAALAFALALLSLIVGMPAADRSYAVALGMAGALLLSVYSGLVPVLVLVAGVTGGWLMWRRGRSAAPYVKILAGAALVGALLANIELVRAIRGVAMEMQIVSGWNIGWGLPEYLAFAAGVRPGSAETRSPLPLGVHLGLAVVPVVCFLVGIWTTFRARRVVPMASALGVLAALLLYFSLVARNPWTGETGHSFTIYKVLNWAFPLILAGQCAGLAVLARRGRETLVVASVAALVSALALPAQLGLARERAQAMRVYASSDQPFEAYRQLVEAVNEYRPDLVYLIAPPEEQHPADQVKYHLHPRPVVSNPNGQELVAAGPNARVLRLVLAQPLSGAYQTWPGGVAVVERDPVVIKMANHAGIEHVDGKPFFRLGSEPMVLRAWASREGPAAFQARARVESGAPSRLRIETGTGQADELAVSADAEIAATIPVKPGVQDIRLIASPLLTDAAQGPRPLRIGDFAMAFADERGALAR